MDIGVVSFDDFKYIENKLYLEEILVLMIYWMKYFLFCVIDCIYLIILFKKYNKGMWSYLFLNVMFL